MRKRTVVMYVLVCLSLLGIISQSYADNAEVLPKGVSRIRVDTNLYFPIDENYNQDGKVEDVAVDYNTHLNSSIFPALGLVEAGFGMAPGSATLGKSVVSFEYDFTIIKIAYERGITDRLTVGIIIPYWWVKNNVDARLDNTNATVGKSAILASLAPIGFLDTVPLTTDDVQNLLGGGLDIDGNGTIDIAGYGYKRIETWSYEGIGDIEAGFRYQYLKTEDWRLAFTSGVRFPTGKIDDPDNLMDYPTGSGAYAILLHLNNDYTGIKNLVLNTTLRYDLVLPKKETLRVPDDPNIPITTNKEEVEIDIGDTFELEASGSYELLKGFNLSLLYKYGYGFRDSVSGSKGFSYESLEDESDYTEHVYIVGLSYSTIPLYMEKKFPLPLTVSTSYRNRFAGANLFKSQYIGLGLQIFF